jgi:hypothetical protein
LRFQYFEIFSEVVRSLSFRRLWFLAHLLLILAAIVPAWSVPLEPPHAGRRAAILAKIAGGEAIIPSQLANPPGRLEQVPAMYKAQASEDEW